MTRRDRRRHRRPARPRRGVQVRPRGADVLELPEPLLEIYLGCAWTGRRHVPINTAPRGNPALATYCETHDETAGYSSSPLRRPSKNAGKRRRAAAYDLDDREGAAVPPAASRIGLAAASSLPGEGRSPAQVRSRTTRSRSSIPRAPRDLRRASAARRRNVLVGRLHRRALLGIREGDVLLTTLPLFHTNALNSVLSGAAERSDLALSSDSRRPASGRRRAARGNRRPISSARWPRCCWRSRRSIDGHRAFPRVALARRRAWPISPAVLVERFGVGLSTATARPKRIVSRGAADPPAPRRRWAICSRALDARASSAAHETLPDGEAGELRYARASRSHSRPVISACRKRP